MAGKFKLEFEMNNAAFADDEDGEIVRILEGIAKRIPSGVGSGIVRDSNGNRVGKWEVDREG